MFDMIGNVFKNLFSKPATRKYPFVKREPFKNTRGEVKDMDINACILCGICQRKCPSDAIKVDRAGKSWEINKYKCIVCGVCSEVCPKKCIFMGESHKTASYQKEILKHVQEPKEAAAPKTEVTAGK